MASPADPILASSIWLRHGTQDGDAVRPQGAKLPFRFQPFDSILEGGLEYGYIHSITSRSEHGARELVQALLISHLSRTPDAAAAIIDSTLSFDVRRFHGSMSTSLESNLGKPIQVMEAMKSLQIMQVFDFIGMNESVSELREALEHGYRPASSSPDLPRGTIADSQAGEEDEALTLVTSPQSPSPKPNVPAPTGTLLIIDDISQLTLPLLKNNYSRGQALLTAFFRSLTHMTRTHNLCTVIIGAASGRPRKPADSDAGLSQFTSCTLRPATGDGLGYLVDTQIYLHSVPTTHEDTVQPLRATQPSIVGRGRSGSVVSVLEIVQDRTGRRAGRWAAFGWDAGGRLQRQE